MKTRQKYKRLAPGKEVRLRNSYVIRHQSTVKDEKSGALIELHCTYDSETRNGPPPDGRKVDGVIHWSLQSTLCRLKFACMTASFR